MANKAKKLNKKIMYNVIMLTLALFIFALYTLNTTFTRYYSGVSMEATGYATQDRSDSYTVIFNGNGNTSGSMANQTIKYAEDTALTNNAFARTSYNFAGWNTEPDGTGTHYANKAVLNITDIDITTINLYAEWSQGVARIDSTYYTTLKAALESVQNGQTKTVYLLTDLHENYTDAYKIQTQSGANITLDLQGYTLYGSSSDAKAIIESNVATLRITNGNIYTDAAQGAINNSSGGTLNLDNVNITVAGKRQAIYNNGGTCTISSTVNITANFASRERPLLHNLAGGTMNINGATITNTGNATGSGNYRATTIANIGTSTLNITDATISATNLEALEVDGTGTVTISGNSNLTSASSKCSTVNVVKGTVNLLGGSIISTNTTTPQPALYTKGTVNIGTQGGGVSTTDPVIQATKYGLYIDSGTVRYYDGVIRGLTKAAINNEPSLTAIEPDYELVHDTVNIDGNNYDQVTLGLIATTYTVTLNANGGTVSPASITCDIGDPIGVLPTPIWAHHTFEGWYTEQHSGTLVQETDTFSSNTSIYAHWADLQPIIVNGVSYNSMAEALANIPAHTLTTITLVDDINEAVEIAADKEIVLNLDGHTITNEGLTKPIITNKGTVTTLNGTLETNSNKTGAIDNVEGGYLVVDGVTIHSHGDKQALYNNASYLEIKGNSYLTSNATGYALNVESNLERATVNNVNNGTLVIISGIIECYTNPGVCSNSGRLTIGVSGGSLSTTTPSIQGNTDGIHCKGTFEYYDGIVKGKTQAINGTVTTMETNTQFVDGTETISGDTYYTKHLESTTP